MNTFSILFLCFLAAAFITQLWLDWRQIRHVKKHCDEVPAAFADKVDLNAHHKAADYTTVKTRLGAFDLTLGYLLLLGWTFGGGLELFDNLIGSLELNPLWSGVLFMLVVSIVMSLLDLPMSIYQTFKVEQRFGFNRQTPALFISDNIKQLLLSIVIGLPLLWVVLWLMGNAGEFWWFYVWLVWMGFSFFMMWAYPAFIAPIFNKFSELEDVTLRERIEQLMIRCGFSSNGIYVMDGSRRSSHGNAYFTGLGNNKRIVFYDTLINTLSHDEVEAVLAHELGHFRRKHIMKHLIIMATMSLLGLALLGWLMQQPWFYHGLGISTPSLHTALMLFMLATPVFTFFFSPIMSLMSRKHEFEADEFAAEHSSAQDLINALVKLYKDNANTLTPDPLHSGFYDSHPPAPVRVAHLETLLKK